MAVIIGQEDRCGIAVCASFFLETPVNCEDSSNRLGNYHGVQQVQSSIALHRQAKL